MWFDNMGGSRLIVVLCIGSCEAEGISKQRVLPSLYTNLRSRCGKEGDMVAT